MFLTAAIAEDCCPGLRSSKGEINLGLDHIELALASPDQARILWRDQLGFSTGDWQKRAGGQQYCTIELADNAFIELIHCSTALDRRSRHYQQLCENGGGPADIILHGSELEHIRYALEAVEEPLEFRDGRSTIELSRPRDSSRQPLRFAQHLLPRQISDTPAQHPNGVSGISELWLATDELARDLLLLELLGGIDSGERRTAAGLATLVQMQDFQILLLPGTANGLIGLSLEVADLQQAAAAMMLPAASDETLLIGEERSFVLRPDQTAGLWLKFEEMLPQA